MKCKRCGYENPDDREYCENCTAPLDISKEDEMQPAWGFVKAPKWAKPDFSADTVSDDDIPADFIREADTTVKEAASAIGAAAVTAGKARDRVAEDRAKLRDKLDDLEDELDDLDDDLDDYDAGRRAAKHTTQHSYKPSARRRVDTVDDLDDDEDLEEEPDRAPRGRGLLNSGNLKPLITIVGIIAALALLAIGLFLIIKHAKGCTTKEKTFDPPVVEQGDEDGTYYFVTVHAPEGTKLVYVTEDKLGRTPYTVPDTCVAKFRVPVSGLLPGKPIDEDVYRATPCVLVVDDEGNETPINIDPISIPVPSLGLTLDNEDVITTNDGKAVVSGRIDYVNANVTIDGEPVDIAADGTFSRELTFNEVGDHEIEVLAQMANYRTAKHTVKVVVNAPVEVDPETIIQMPWDYGDNSFSQRIVNSLTAIDVRGKVPEGSTVTVSSESTNATLTTPTVDPDGTFHFTLTMQKAGDYTVTVNCTTPEGNDYSRDIHLQRQPDYSQYISGAMAYDYSQFSYGSSQQYKISGMVRHIIHEGDYYLAKFELSDGHSIILEYHNHYGSAGAIEEGRSYSNIYGRSKGFDSEGNIVFYVWFIND